MQSTPCPYPASDHYWLRVERQQEFFAGRDVARGLKRGRGVTEVFVVSVGKRDGLVTETTLTTPREDHFSPGLRAVEPCGGWWKFDGKDRKSGGAHRWKRQRSPDEVLLWPTLIGLEGADFGAEIQRLREIWQSHDEKPSAGIKPRWG
jgi:hypothetical protein